jgi:hypothetical protein
VYFLKHLLFLNRKTPVQISVLFSVLLTALPTGQLFSVGEATCTLDGHVQSVTYTRCCIDTIGSPDDEHEVS